MSGYDIGKCQVTLVPFSRSQQTMRSVICEVSFLVRTVLSLYFITIVATVFILYLGWALN